MGRVKSNQGLERVRDAFVFGCCIRLRFQDYSAIKSENIVQVGDEDKYEVEYFLKVKTQKTDELVYIPCNAVVLQYLKSIKTMLTGWLQLLHIKTLTSILKKNVKPAD